MKHPKFLACLLALATIAGAAAASAADQPRVSIGLGGQYWLAKAVKDVLDEKGLWGGNIIVRIQPIAYLGIDLRAGAVGVWGKDSWRYRGQRYETSASFMCCPFEAGLVLILPVEDRVQIYGGGGAGYYYYDIDIDIESTSRWPGYSYRSGWNDFIDLEDDVGWYALGGLKISLASHFALFGEARYTATETRLKHFDGFKIDCSGAAFQVGVMFDF